MECTPLGNGATPSLLLASKTVGCGASPDVALGIVSDTVAYSVYPDLSLCLCLSVCVRVCVCVSVTLCVYLSVCVGALSSDGVALSVYGCPRLCLCLCVSMCI
jgi:hypothetical protein